MPIHHTIIQIVRTVAQIQTQAVGGAQVPTAHGTMIRHGAGAVLIRGIQAQPTGAATGKDGEKHGNKS